MSEKKKKPIHNLISAFTIMLFNEFYIPITNWAFILLPNVFLQLPQIAQYINFVTISEFNGTGDNLCPSSQKVTLAVNTSLLTCCIYNFQLEVILVSISESVTNASCLMNKAWQDFHS